MIWRQRIIRILADLGILGETYYFIKNFLSHRSIEVKVNNTLSDPTTIENGIPQGSVISTTIFLLSMNAFIDRSASPINSTMFADDLTKFVTGKNIETTQELLQQELNSLQNFALENGFKFSTNKSQ